MPIYEYRCLNCNNRFEIMHLASKKEDAVCSKCGSKKTVIILPRAVTHHAAAAPAA